MSGSTIDVKETIARFTTDVTAYCVFGMNGDSLMDPDSKGGRRIRRIRDFNVQQSLLLLMAFFAPYLNTVFGLKFLDDKTNNYVRQMVWNAVQYR